MKLGYKGNQVSLFILHEFPGYMIKVKGHLGSMNFDHQSQHCCYTYIELRNAGETARGVPLVFNRKSYFIEKNHLCMSLFHKTYTNMGNWVNVISGNF